MSKFQIINFKNYFAKDLKREILELYASTTIKYFALSLISIFEPVYLYTLGYSLQWIIFYFAITYTVVFFAAPFGGKLAVRFGFEHCILYSVPVLIVYYLFLYSIPSLPVLFFIAPFLFAFHKILFWPAYHANFVYYGNKSKRAMEISSIKGLVYLVAIAGPIIGGIILTFFGFKILFIIVCLILFASIIPLFTTLEKFEPGKFGYFKAFRDFLNPKFRRTRFAFMGFAEDVVELTCWPIFIFLILASYASLGIIASGGTIASFLSIFLIGKWADKNDKRKMIRVSTVIYSLTWLIKSFIQTGLGLFLINSLSGISKRGISVPMTAIIYNEGSKRGNLKCIIFREMSIYFGRSLMAWGLIGVLFFTNSWLVIFSLAAMASLLYMLIENSK